MVSLTYPGRRNNHEGFDTMITERTMREGLIDLCRHDQERLVKMALAKLHVSKFHRHYDDFYQEGCIAYARAYVAVMSV